MYKNLTLIWYLYQFRVSARQLGSKENSDLCQPVKVEVLNVINCKVWVDIIRPCVSRVDVNPPVSFLCTLMNMVHCWGLLVWMFSFFLLFFMCWPSLL